VSKTVTRLRQQVTGQVLEGPGQTTLNARRAAYEDRDGTPARELLAKVAKHAWKVTDEDVAAARATLPDDDIYELVICAAIGKATRQLDHALAALDEAEGTS
jgi:hypothetical protein